MLRTTEALIVVVLVLSALLWGLNFAVIPSPHITTSIGLEELAASTLQSLDEDNILTETVFSSDDAAWVNLQNTLDATLPPNIIYRLTLYRGGITYTPVNSVCNFEGDFPSGSATTSFRVTSPNVTVTITPEKISSNGKEVTLYILNCEDANGWWITGYSGQTLASDLYNILSPYFGTTVLVNSTYQLGQLLNGTSLNGEDVLDAVIINTFGEAVPIPAGYYATEGYSGGSYAKYPYLIGKRVNSYNWTWVSIVGYPLYYVSNTVTFTDRDNNWGIYGMRRVGPAGFNGFLQGLNDMDFVYNSDWETEDIGVVDFTSAANEMTNYYGVYPEAYQTSTRALPIGYLQTYNVYLNPEATIFEPKSVGSESFYAGATFSHKVGGVTHGSFTAIGLARTPDIRISVLGLLMFYQPKIYRSEFGASGTSMIVVLQLGQLGGN